MIKNLTALDFLKIQTCAAMAGAPVLSEAARFAQVEFARQCRNAWFTSSIMSQVAFTEAAQFSPNITVGNVISETPPFSDPLILTELISMYELSYSDRSLDDILGAGAQWTNLAVAITQYGGEGNAYGQDFFGAYNGPLLSWLTLRHERNRLALTDGIDIPVNEMMDKWVSFVPHLLRPYERLRVTYSFNFDLISNSVVVAIPHMGARAVRVLAFDNPYSKLTPLARARVIDYIKGSEPDTFFLEVKTPLASLGAVGTGFVELRTLQQGRPLLILGAASNVDGCQARIMDENGYYQFTQQRKPNQAEFPGTEVYADPPLSLIAPNTDYRNTDLFNMWPVPHFLEPGASLKIRLANGCFPSLSTSTPLLQRASTRNSQDVRITFLCRTP